MLSDFKRLYRAFRLKAANGKMNEQPPEEKVPIPPSVQELCKQLPAIFHGSGDVILKPYEKNTALLVFIDQMTDRYLLTAQVMGQVEEAVRQANADPKKKNADFFKSRLLSACTVEIKDDLNECVEQILSGDTLLFVDGSSAALSIGMPRWEKRSIDEPKTDNVVRGPREGFTETISTNKVLIRRKIKDPALVFEDMTIGRQTKTLVSLCYLQNVANDEIVREARKRLSNIHAQAILESGYIEEYIEDAPFSVFSTVGNSERPDTVAGRLLEGRVAILCDGTPFVLTVPHLFEEDLQSSEDYYTRWVNSALLRFLRVTAFLLGTSLPAYYCAFVCFHQDVIPFKLLLTIASSANNIPFPPFLECLILIITFELIREGGIRMPRSLGQAVSIVGALIVGQAAVQAGLVSTPAVIVISTTAICSFVLSRLESSMFIIRIVLLILSSITGFLGIVLGSIVFFILMCGLRSFGVPYMAPFAPLYNQEMEDTFLRMPIWSMLRKPKSLTEKYSGNNPSGK